MTLEPQMVCAIDIDGRHVWPLVSSSSQSVHLMTGPSIRYPYDSLMEHARAQAQRKAGGQGLRRRATVQ